MTDEARREELKVREGEGPEEYEARVDGLSDLRGDPSSSWAVLLLCSRVHLYAVTQHVGSGPGPWAAS